MLFFVYITVTAGKVAGGQDVKEYISFPRLKADGSWLCFSFFCLQLLVDKVVKTSISRWISKKLHIGGVQFFYYFGVHKVRRNDRKIAPQGHFLGRNTNKMKNFYNAITG